MAIGHLVVNVFVDNVAQPLMGARVNISGNNTNINVVTDESGRTEAIALEAPNIEYSLEPQTIVQPWETA